MEMQKQTMKKIDIHDYLKKKGFDVSYSTVKGVTQYLETKHQEAFIRQDYQNYAPLILSEKGKTSS